MDLQAGITDFEGPSDRTAGVSVFQQVYVTVQNAQGATLRL